MLDDPKRHPPVSPSPPVVVEGLRCPACGGEAIARLTPYRAVAACLCDGCWWTGTEASARPRAPLGQAPVA